VSLGQKPVQIGQPCSVEPPLLSGQDDCGVGAMCWYLDERGLAGICVPLCKGRPEEPCCEDESRACVGTEQYVPALCVERCNPLLQDCTELEFACTVLLDEMTLACEPVMNTGTGIPGDACTVSLDCEPGLACRSAAELASCSGSACCTPFCDTTLPNNCPDAAVGQECLPWYEPGTAPEGYENVGVCTCPGGCP
jgi:hypothetical protein